ncbi:hypothetical protein AYO44_06460 [Planctomycetaceae bacterium SCGC AG-212-F19]|nr:hypothetical protein AYO44_06460 [Planctomycetaceae bacterium SCGC AG-212-F19]
MALVTCPSCNTPLPPAELAEGWCESCGKKIPPYLLGSVKESRRDGIDGSGEPGQPARESFGAERVHAAVDADGLAVESTRLRFARLAITLAVILVANGIVAYALAGTRIWIAVLAVAGFITVVIAFYTIKDMVFGGLRSASGAEFGTRIGLLVYAVVLLGSGFLVSEQFARGTVHVDNFSSQDVVLELDGRVWLKATTQSTQRASLTQGSYTLVVRSPTGTELDRQAIEVEGRDDYVLNVLSAQVYARGEAQYGTLSFGMPRQERAVKAPWFKADVDFLFEEPPESITVSVKRGQTVASASKTYLRRGPPRTPAD